MKFLKKSTMSLALTAAVSGGAMVGVTAPAQAVNLAQDQLGEAIVFPYYNTRNNWSSLFNLTNTSADTVIVKVRWREGVNSRDARDFNVVLSPYDVWTALVRDSGTGAEMITADTSCTFPELPSQGTNSDGKALTGIAFTNTAYTLVNSEDNRDRGDETLDRTREGYFEVISMGRIDNAAPLNALAATIANNAKHINVSGNNATPLSCNTVRAQLRNNSVVDINNALLPAENVLKGRAILVNADDGIAAGYDPMVLANFAGVPLYQDPSSPLPDLGSADPIAVVIDDNTATANVVPTTTGEDAVSELVLRNAVINDYNVKGDSETDWILTFPTKNFYVDRALSPTASFATIPFGGLAPLAPFDAPVNGEAFSSVQNGKSCVDININLWDREEYEPTTTFEDEFSPREPGIVTRNQICYETNILSFGDSDLFGSALQKSLFAGNEAGLPGLNGWARVAFGQTGAASLPVVGMRVEVRRRANEAGKNYGLANNHAYQRAIQMQTIARP